MLIYAHLRPRFRLFFCSFIAKATHFLEENGADCNTFLFHTSTTMKGVKFVNL